MGRPPKPFRGKTEQGRNLVLSEDEMDTIETDNACIIVTFVGKQKDKDVVLVLTITAAGGASTEEKLEKVGDMSNCNCDAKTISVTAKGGRATFSYEVCKP